jgi:hypothetical protein
MGASQFFKYPQAVSLGLHERSLPSQAKKEF